MTLDPVKTADHLAAGARLWRVQHAEPPDLRDVIWELVAEACRTMRALNAGRPREYGGAWPEIVLLASELVGAYNERATERREAEKEGRLRVGYDAPADAPAQPSAAALARFLDVVGWLRFIPARDGQKARRMELLLALAGGLSPTRACNTPRFATLHLNSRHAVVAFKNRSLTKIEAEIRKACPDVRVGIYAA